MISGATHDVALTLQGAEILETLADDDVGANTLKKKDKRAMKHELFLQSQCLSIAHDMTVSVTSSSALQNSRLRLAGRHTPSHTNGD